MNKKLLFSGITLSLSLLAIFAFRYHAAAFFIEKYVQSVLGSSLAYESHSFNRQTLTFEKPSFSGIKAEKAAIDYHLDVPKRTIDVTLMVDRPSILLEPREIDWEALFSKIDHDFPLFKVNLQLRILDGEMRWDQSRNAYFSLDSAFGQHHQGGSLTLCFSDKADQTNSLALHLFEQRARMQIELECRDLLIADFTDLASHFFPSLRSWKVIDGIANGGMKVTFPKDSSMQTEGDLSLKNVKFHQSDWQLHGNCQEMRLHVDPHFQGKCELVSPASLSFKSDNGLAWELSQIQGGVALEGHDAIRIALEGIYSHQHITSQARLSGSMSLPAARFPLFDLNLHIDTSGASGKSTNIAMRSLMDHPQSLEMEFTQFSYEDFAFFQDFFGTFWPYWNNISIKDGVVDAIVQADFADKGIEALKIKRLHADSIWLDYHPWNISWKVQKLKGCLECDPFSEDLLHSLNGDLSIANGELSWLEDNLSTSRFEKIQTELSINQGVIQKSLVGLNFRGLQGWVELNGDMFLNNIHTMFSGTVKDLYPFVPDRIQRELQQELNDHKVTISSYVRRTEDEIEVKGMVRIFEDPANRVDQIEFNLNCGGWSDLVCRRGWFYAKDIPLEKYLSPFIFKDNCMLLSGIGEFKGTFDQQNILIHYDAHDLVLKNDALAIEVPRLYSDANFSHDNPLIAYHHFDLSNHISEGVLPIRHATYFEKNSGLLFTDIHTKVVFDGDVIRCKELEGFSNGVYLAGQVVVDLSSPEPDVFTVDMHMPSLDGRVSQVQQMLSHFEESRLLSKIPLDGNLAFRGHGGHLHFDFFPGDYTWQGVAEGNISNGMMTADQVDLSLQDFCLDFSYDSRKNTLAFDDIQGSLLVGKKDHVDEYLLTGKHLAFSNFRDREMDFDLTLGDKDRDLIRLVGSTKQNSPGSVEFVIDKRLTHCGDLYPSQLELVLTNWSDVKTFHLHTCFKLNAFLRDLQKFEKTGLLCFSRHLLQRLQCDPSAQGDIDLDLCYDSDKASLLYQATGNDLTFQGLHFKTFAIHGKKQDKTWVIDQLQLGNLSLAADLRCHHDSWNVHFLGLRYGKSLLLGLEGQYNDEGEYLDAKVNLAEVDLAHLGEWDSLKEAIGFLRLQGRLHGTGKMKVKFLEHSPWIQVDTSLQANLDGFRMKNFQIDIKDPLACSFSSNGRFSLEKAHIVVWDDLFGRGENQSDMKAIPKDYYLSDLVFEKDEQDFRFSTRYHGQKAAFWANGSVALSGLDKGTLVLIDHPGQTSPLRIGWKYDSGLGFSIDKAYGHFWGLDFALTKDDKNTLMYPWTVLKGDITVDPQRSFPLFSQEIADKIKSWQIGGRYLFQGDWMVDQEKISDLLDHLYFRGILSGQEFIAKGYRLQQLSAVVDYSPQQVMIQEVKANDAAGSLSCPEVILTKNGQDQWFLQAPSILVENLRPSLLRDVSQTKPAKLKPLLIKQIALENCQGYLEDVSSFQGKGSLSFVNPPKNYLKNTLFAIPAEILKRIGLDPHVMTPVTGLISLQIQGDRIHLTRFKDVYSEGRASKFYLARRSEGSWVDMNGNLYIQVRMKQYNLLFKLAELFTVTITGNLKKPSYTLHKQPHSMQQVQEVTVGATANAEEN